MKNSWQRAWEQISIYLPVFLMAALALGTWWLVRNAPKPLQEHVRSVMETSPDYVLQDFSVRQFDQTGRLQTEIKGDFANHYPQTDSLEIDTVSTMHLGLNGVLTTSSGNKGISNADASEIQLLGQAQVEKRDPVNPTQYLKIESDFLHAWTNEEKMKTHLPVVITQGHARFQADSMEYNNLLQIVNLNGRVKGFIPAKK